MPGDEPGMAAMEPPQLARLAKADTRVSWWLLGWGSEQPAEWFDVFLLGEEQDSVAALQFQRTTGSGCGAISDDERYPGMLPQGELADCLSGCSRTGTYLELVGGRRFLTEPD